MSAQRVLIVEDERWLAHQQATTLRNAGYETAVAGHGVSAIGAIDTFSPDCIVLDILLPASTGFTLLHELQSYEDTNGLPIILSTSLADEIDLKDVASYGVKRILNKATMKPDDLVAAVRSVI